MSTQTSRPDPDTPITITIKQRDLSAYRRFVAQRNKSRREAYRTSQLRAAEAEQRDRYRTLRQELDLLCKTRHARTFHLRRVFRVHQANGFTIQSLVHTIVVLKVQGGYILGHSAQAPADRECNKVGNAEAFARAKFKLGLWELGQIEPDCTDEEWSMSKVQALHKEECLSGWRSERNDNVWEPVIFAGWRAKNKEYTAKECLEYIVASSAGLDPLTKEESSEA